MKTLPEFYQPGLSEHTCDYEDRITAIFDKLTKEQQAEVTSILDNLHACRFAGPDQDAA